MDEFTLPESLSALTVENLSTLEAEAVQAFDALTHIEPDALSDANVAEMERLAGAIQTLRTERATRAATAQARRDRAAAAAALVTASQAEPPDEEVVPEESDDEDSSEDAAEAADQSASKVVVATGAVVPSVSKARKQPVVRPKTGGITLVAAADVPGFSTGSRLDDLKAVAHAFSNRVQGFPRGRVPDTYIRAGVATIQQAFPDGLVDTNRDLDPMELFDEAARESRLPGGSLVAAGGWCAPSETLYDLCVTESLDGLIDLPEVGITRGGIRFTKGPAFEDIYSDAGFILTEAQVIAGTTKPCIEIECPPFTEVRLDVEGICVKAPILTNVGYPELVRRWIEGTLVAQQHKLSGQVISRMVATAGAATVITGGAGSGFDLLTALEWVSTTQRYRYRMALSATLEVVLPLWVKPIVRADLAIRQGVQDISVSDAQIDAHFAARGVRVQWVYNWQDLDTTAATGSACYADIPATFNALVYPAGTFVKGTADVISLDAIYDSTNIQQNMFTAAFAESGFLVANRCYSACLITIPTCIAGKTGGPLAACLDMGEDVTP